MPSRLIVFFAVIFSGLFPLITSADDRCVIYYSCSDIKNIKVGPWYYYKVNPVISSEAEIYENTRIKVEKRYEVVIRLNPEMNQHIYKQSIQCDQYVVKVKGIDDDYGFDFPAFPDDFKKAEDIYYKIQAHYDLNKPGDSIDELIDFLLKICPVKVAGD